ncbi:MAG TPA: HEAT repeat domain-containing protein [Methanomicrobiales archaeon]|nr:HEAT repeat domain-containing protein [Methanomicrobiales archaeon]
MAGTGEGRPDIEGMARRGEFGALVAVAGGSSPDTMSDILDALIGAGEAAVPYLLAALREKDEQVHMVASIALEKIGKAAVIPLIRAFHEKDGLVRVKIADILANIGDPAMEEIIAALRDPDEEVRVLSALVLGEMRDPRAIDPLIAALADGSGNVRAQSAISLGELGDARARDALGRLADSDEDPAVRQVAANAFIRIMEVAEGDTPPAPPQKTPR